MKVHLALALLCVFLALSPCHGAVSSRQAQEQAQAQNSPSSKQEKSKIVIVSNNNRMKNWLAAPDTLDHAALEEMGRKSDQEDFKKHGHEAKTKQNQRKAHIKEKQEEGEKDVRREGRTKKEKGEHFNKKLKEQDSKNEKKMKGSQEAHEKDQRKKEEAQKADIKRAERLRKHQIEKHQKSEAGRKAEAKAKEAARRRSEQKQKAEARSKEGAVKAKQQRQERAAKALVEKRKKKVVEVSRKAEAKEKAWVNERRRKPYQRSRKTCLGWGDPHYVTFSGAKYDYYGEGEFVFYKDAMWQEQVNVEMKKPRSNFPVSYHTGATFKSRWHRISVQYEAPRHKYEPRLYLDGHRVKWRYGGTYRAGALWVKMGWQPGRKWWGAQIVHIRNTASGTDMTVHSLAHRSRGENMRYMDVRVHVNGFFKPPKGGGLCGQWGSGRPWVLNNGRVAGSPQQMVGSWRVPRSQSLFVMHRHLHITSDQAARKASQLSPLQLAGGNKAIVDRATRACVRVPVATRHACIVDYIAGGGKAAVTEAAKEAQQAKG